MASQAQYLSHDLAMSLTRSLTHQELQILAHLVTYS